MRRELEYAKGRWEKLRLLPPVLTARIFEYLVIEFNLKFLMNFYIFNYFKYQKSKFKYNLIFKNNININ
jgi:hypothetical protein